MKISLLASLTLASVYGETAVIIDAGGKHPQCSEGPKEYIEKCVFPSDYFSYILSAAPKVVTSNGTIPAITKCADLEGYELIGPDPIFSDFKLYWKGGAAAFGKFQQEWGPGHAQLGAFLNTSRDSNPHCKTGGHAKIEEKGGGEAATTAEEEETVYYYDASGKWPQCSEGPAAYMDECVLPSDFFFYVNADKPTKGTAAGGCKALNGGEYEYVSPDGVFSGFKLYWKGGAAAFQAAAGPYIAGHPDLVAFLNATRDANPKCKHAPIPSPPKLTPPKPKPASGAVCKDAQGQKDETCPAGQDSCCPSRIPGQGQACFDSATEECCASGPGAGHVCFKGKCSTRSGFICD